MHSRESRAWPPARSRITLNKHDRVTSITTLVPYYYNSISNPSKTAGGSFDWLFCTKFWTNTWRLRWIMWIWFCAVDLSEDLLSNRDSKYLAVSSRLFSELLLNWIHYQAASPRWLQCHPSEVSCLLYHVRRRAHFIAAISTRSLEIIIQTHIYSGHFITLSLCVWRWNASADSVAPKPRHRWLLLRLLTSPVHG